jgi:REP element-mobilizing transposase RayT
MPRQTIHEEEGGYHIISRIVGQQFLMGPEEKDHFVSLLHQLSKVYFVSLHAYCVLDNHFHLLVTLNQSEAFNADSRELTSRLNQWRAFNARPVESGISNESAKLLRERFSSVSRFTQDLKQEFSRWLNKKIKRKGYLWSDRFKGILISHGKAQLACAAYIEMNPVRAKLVESPEQYPWSSRGLMALNQESANHILSPVYEMQEQGDAFENYKDFIRSVLQEEMDSFASLDGVDFGVKQASFSQGCVLGTKELVSTYRENTGKLKRKVPQLFDIDGLCVTRVLNRGYSYT